MKEIKRDTIEIEHEGESLKIGYFYRAGEGIHPESIYFLHGLGCNSKPFERASSEEGLNAYNLIGFNFPGCGEAPYKSTYPREKKLGMQDLVEITHQVRQRLGEMDILHGHSMGGLVGMLYIQAYGEGLQAFANVEGNLTEETCTVSQGISAQKREEFIVRKHFNKIRTTLKRNGRGNPGLTSWATVLRNMDLPGRRAVWDFSISMVEESTPELLKNYLNLSKKIKTAYFVGEENIPLYSKVLNSHSEMIIPIPGSNHFPFIDNPDYHYRQLATWLEK